MKILTYCPETAAVPPSNARASEAVVATVVASVHVGDVASAVAALAFETVVVVVGKDSTALVVRS